MTTRRIVTALLLVLVAPLAVEAQPAGKVWRIGFLGGSRSTVGPFIQAFEQGLAELGYVDGQNIAIEYRSAQGKDERLPGQLGRPTRRRADLEPLWAPTPEGVTPAHDRTRGAPEPARDRIERQTALHQLEGTTSAIFQDFRRTLEPHDQRVRFAFRNFPLAEMHPHALRAAEAAEGAGAQGKFWQMHDMLYEHQRALDDRERARAELLLHALLDEHRDAEARLDEALLDGGPQATRASILSSAPRLPHSHKAHRSTCCRS